jgi:threonine aldolase
MNFASDNTGPVHPKVMEALARANEGYALPYGNDDLSRQVADRIREVFEAPEAAVYLVATGTAANSLILATMTPAWSTVFCAPHAHINEDECNAPEFYSGGAKLTLVGGDGARIDPDLLAAAIGKEETRGVHGPQRGPVSITQATEKGTVYSREEIREIASVARRFGLKLHLDGARFANALVRLGCSAAEMTWKAGVDAVSFGGTKNGLMGVEAVVIFDKSVAWEFELRRKRGAHLFSKHRYLAAQMGAYLEDDLWIEMAAAANGACDRLARGLRQVPGAALHYEPQANIIFAEWSRAGHRRLHEAGAQYYLWTGSLEDGPEDEALTARLVTDWSASDAGIGRFLELARG